MKIVKENFDNKVTLTEAFSDSMPKWLQGYIVNFATKDGYQKQWPDNKFVNKSANDPSTIYSYIEQGRGFNTNLVRQMYRNLDYSRAEFIPCEPPKLDISRNDTSKMYFYHLNIEGNVYVYSPRFNDDEKVAMPTKDGGIKSVLLKYFNDRNVKMYCDACCYIDLQNQNNFKAQLKSDRKDAKQGMIDRPGKQLVDKDDMPTWSTPSEYDRYKNFKDNPTSKFAAKSQRYDASGYIVNPQKYEDELRKLHRNNYASKLDDCYRRLKSAYKLYVDAISDYDIFDTGNRFGNITNEVSNNFQDAKKYYDRALGNIQDAKDNAQDEYWFNRYVDYALGNIDYCKRYLDEVENSLKEYSKVKANWQSDDMWDDEE